MRDLDGWIHKAATAAFDQPDATNFVFTMRKILTEAWQEGFDAGEQAQLRDSLAVRHVHELIAKSAGADEQDGGGR